MHALAHGHTHAHARAHTQHTHTQTHKHHTHTHTHTCTHAGVEVWEIDPRYWPPTYEYGEYDDESPPGWYPPFEPGVPPGEDYYEE